MLLDYYTAHSLRVFLSVSLSFSLFFSLSIFLSLSLYIYISLSLFLSLSLSLSLCVCVCMLSGWVCEWLCVCVCVYMCASSLLPDFRTTSHMKANLTEDISFGSISHWSVRKQFWFLWEVLVATLRFYTEIFTLLDWILITLLNRLFMKIYFTG